MIKTGGIERGGGKEKRKNLKIAERNLKKGGSEFLSFSWVAQIKKERKREKERMQFHTVRHIRLRYDLTFYFYNKCSRT